MIKISVCYSNKNGTEFASCGLSDIEIDPAVLANPAALKDKIAEAYETCELMVRAQLGTAAPAPTMPAPIAARMDAPPPAPMSPPPVSNGNGRSDPPSNARELGGWAKARGLTKYFSELGRANNRRGLISEWDDTFAVWAYEHWLASQAPAAPSTNGVHH